MTVVRPLLTILLLVACISPALAQTAEPDQRALFGGYVNSPAYREYLETIFNRGEPPALKAQCPALTIIESNKTIVVEQPKFVRAGAGWNIESGAWVAMAALDRCGTRVIRRALLTAAPGANLLRPKLLLPGEFLGNLKLEQDAIRIVLSGLMAMAKCQDTATVWVLDIKTQGQATPQGWSETWTAQACGKTVDADVTYTADATGMNISAGNWKVH